MVLNGNLRTSLGHPGRIAYLKERAMADNTRYTFIFDVANNRYRSSHMKSDEWKYAFSARASGSAGNFRRGSTVGFETRAL
jgi:hypothetical protein